MLIRTYKIFVLMLIAVAIVSCTAGPDKTGLEYAPQMYHSTPYEPLSQIQDKEIGSWLDSNPDDEHGEFYNSNEYNPFGMTMLIPVEGTVRRGTLASNIAPEDYERAEAEMISPYNTDPKIVLTEGKALYERFCEHCHGTKGLGDGKVGKVYKGVPAYNSAAVKDKAEGHIFHVITHGKGRMGAHASQISIEERWKIVAYVQTLQKL